MRSGNRCRHFEGLSAFCRILNAPVDNNEIERLIKLIVRARKNSLFFKTQNDADVSDVITSILATCTECEANAFDYLQCVQRNQLAVRAMPKNGCRGTIRLANDGWSIDH